MVPHRFDAPAGIPPWGLPAVGTDDTFFDRLAHDLRQLSGYYLDKGLFDSAAAVAEAHGDVFAAFDEPWGTRCAVPDAPVSAPLDSRRMVDFMDACADALLAMKHTGAEFTPGAGIGYKAEAQWDSVDRVYGPALVSGDGERRTHLYATMAGTFRGYAVKYGWDFSALGTGVSENSWHTLGSVGDGGGAVLWPRNPVRPTMAHFPQGFGFCGFSFWVLTFTPVFTPIRSLIEGDGEGGGGEGGE